MSTKKTESHIDKWNIRRRKYEEKHTLWMVALYNIIQIIMDVLKLKSAPFLIELRRMIGRIETPPEISICILVYLTNTNWILSGRSKIRRST